MPVDNTTWPWSQALVVVAVLVPALWIGGVPTLVVPVFIALAAALWIRQGRSKRQLYLPAGTWVLALLCLVTALQLLPLPDAVLGVVAPGSSELATRALTGTDVDGWHRVSVHPPATALELGRLLGLALLFVAASQLSWRVCAGAVIVCATLVALLGLAHEALGLERIYGVYAPRIPNARNGAAMLTTFVNSNHQSGLFLLGSFSAAGLARDQYLRAAKATDEARAGRLRDRSLATLAALVTLLAALMLSLSRGALLVLALLAPVALYLTWRGRRLGSTRHQISAAKLALASLPLVAVVVVAASRGVWAHLATLTDPTTFSVKMRVIREALWLVPFAPVIGIGRGSFVDLFPLVDSDPSAVVFTHNESTWSMMIVEWGPVAGGVALLGLLWWWLQAFRTAESTARRVVLLGLLAVGLHGIADFSLEFLGVAAPSVALAGSLAAPGRELSPRAWLGCGALVVVGALGFAYMGQGSGWVARMSANDSMGEVEARAAVRQRPLDARLHLRLARDELERGRFAQARSRAEVASELLPASVDARLLLGAAAHALGEHDEADEATRMALARLVEPPPPELVGYLVTRYPDPKQLAALAPEDPSAWRPLADGLAVAAPRHLRALAWRRLDMVGDELALEYGFKAAVALDNPALALHYSRLLRAQDPDRAQYHLWVADALASLASDNSERSITELEAALDNSLDDPGLIEERLLSLLLARPDDAAADTRARARELADQLLSRPATRPIRARRERMVKRLGRRR